MEWLITANKTTKSLTSNAIINLRAIPALTGEDRWEQEDIEHTEDLVKLGYQTAQLLSITTWTQWGNPRFYCTDKFGYIPSELVLLPGLLHCGSPLAREHFVPAASCCASCQWVSQGSLNSCTLQIFLRVNWTPFIIKAHSFCPAS